MAKAVNKAIITCYSAGYELIVTNQSALCYTSFPFPEGNKFVIARKECSAFVDLLDFFFLITVVLIQCLFDKCMQTITTDLKISSCSNWINQLCVVSGIYFNTTWIKISSRWNSV